MCACALEPSRSFVKGAQVSHSTRKITPPSTLSLTWCASKLGQSGTSHNAFLVTYALGLECGVGGQPQHPDFWSFFAPKSSVKPLSSNNSSTKAPTRASISPSRQSRLQHAFLGTENAQNGEDWTLVDIFEVDMQKQHARSSATPCPHLATMS